MCVLQMKMPVGFDNFETSINLFFSLSLSLSLYLFLSLYLSLSFSLIIIIEES